MRVTDTFLAGFGYAANFGWICFGDGAPANGYSYANSSGTNYGVNLSLTGNLTGYAYGANIGWIIFEQSLGKPKLNLITGQFTGYAYSANIGWIALNTTLSTLATTSINRFDSDGDGIPDAWERFYFGNLTTANATSDSDGDGMSDLAEYLAGTDPTDRDSYLRITDQSYSPNHNTATITWTIVPTRQYRLEHNSELTGPWLDATGNFTPPSGATATRSAILSIGEGPPRQFFRVIAVPSLP